MGRYTYCKELKEAVRKTGVAEWAQGGYVFRFDTLEFWWNGRSLDITSSRAAHLYHRLVLGKKDSVSPLPGTMAVLRKKYGESFLEEFLPKMKQKFRGQSGGRKPYTWWDDDDTRKLVEKLRERKNK